MANKLYAREQLTEEVAKDVAASPQEWMRCLNTASRPVSYTHLDVYKRQPQGDATLKGAVYVLYAREYIVYPDGATGTIYKACLLYTSRCV